MTPEQMRELADILEPMAAAPVFDRLDIPGAVALLRQCAEQQPSEQPASGWKLVPVEPTAEMLSATSWPGCARADYAHMLAAAPAPTAQREPLSDEQIEAAYWEFDARKKGYGQWKGCPMTDRDAFKWALRAALAAKE